MDGKSACPESKCRSRPIPARPAHARKPAEQPVPRLRPFLQGKASSFATTGPRPTAMAESSRTPMSCRTDHPLPMRCWTGGFARVSAQADCAADLLAREQWARNAKLGLWGQAYYAVIGAENLGALSAERGHFTVVEGRVVSVRESAGT